MRLMRFFMLFRKSATFSTLKNDKNSSNFPSSKTLKTHDNNQANKLNAMLHNHLRTKYMTKAEIMKDALKKIGYNQKGRASMYKAIIRTIGCIAICGLLIYCGYQSMDYLQTQSGRKTLGRNPVKYLIGKFKGQPTQRTDMTLEEHKQEAITAQRRQSRMSTMSDSTSDDEEEREEHGVESGDDGELMIIWLRSHIDGVQMEDTNEIHILRTEKLKKVKIVKSDHEDIERIFQDSQTFEKIISIMDTDFKSTWKQVIRQSPNLTYSYCAYQKKEPVMPVWGGMEYHDRADDDKDLYGE